MGTKYELIFAEKRWWVIFENEQGEDVVVPANSDDVRDVEELSFKQMNEMQGLLKSIVEKNKED